MLLASVLRPLSLAVKVMAWLAMGLAYALQAGAGDALSSNSSTVTLAAAV